MCHFKIDLLGREEEDLEPSRNQGTLRQCWVLLAHREGPCCALFISSTRGGRCSVIATIVAWGFRRVAHRITSMLIASE